MVGPVSICGSGNKRLKSVTVNGHNRYYVFIAYRWKRISVSEWMRRRTRMVLMEWTLKDTEQLIRKHLSPIAGVTDFAITYNSGQNATQSTV